MTVFNIVTITAKMTPTDNNHTSILAGSRRACSRTTKATDGIRQPEPTITQARPYFSIMG